MYHRKGRGLVPMRAIHILRIASPPFPSHPVVLFLRITCHYDCQEEPVVKWPSIYWLRLITVWWRWELLINTTHLAVLVMDLKWHLLSLYQYTCNIFSITFSWRNHCLIQLYLFILKEIAMGPWKHTSVFDKSNQ